MKILITGAGRAIGAAMASERSARDHEVVASARDMGLLDDLNVAMKISLDVTDDASVEWAVTECGDIDALVNNAAFPVEDRSRQCPSTAFALSSKPKSSARCV